MFARTRRTQCNVFFGIVPCPIRCAFNRPHIHAVATRTELSHPCAASCPLLLPPGASASACVSIRAWGSRASACGVL